MACHSLKGYRSFLLAIDQIWWRDNAQSDVTERVKRIADATIETTAFFIAPKCESTMRVPERSLLACQCRVNDIGGPAATDMISWLRFVDPCRNRVVSRGDVTLGLGPSI